VSLHDLIMANGLSRKAVIFIGQNLRIPVREQPNIPPAASQLPVVQAIGSPGPAQAVSGEVAALPAPADNRVNPLVDTSNLKIQKIVGDTNARVGIIQVEAEETLGHYADWLNIPTSRIRSLNRLSFGTPISISQTIKIPLTATDPDSFEEKRFEFHREIEEDFFDSFMISAVETYTIQPGDTIWSLCLKQLEIPFWLLKKYNPKTDFSAMHPGQTLNYPVVAGKRGDVVL
jgi:membrane-bound lytic murein transglycosylase D